MSANEKPVFRGRGGGLYLLCTRRFLSNACSIVYRDNAYGESRGEKVGIKGRWVAPKGKDSVKTPPLVCMVLRQCAKACRKRARALDNNAMIRFGRKRRGPDAVVQGEDTRQTRETVHHGYVPGFTLK